MYASVHEFIIWENAWSVRIYCACASLIVLFRRLAILARILLWTMLWSRNRGFRLFVDEENTKLIKRYMHYIEI